MKVCYFIQTHKNPAQIYRLVRTIKTSSPDAQILIGHDFTSSHLDITPLQGLGDVHLLKSKSPSLRGDFSLLQPYLNAVDWLFENESDFDWLIYLSGQDYPTKAPAEIEHFLAQTDYNGFIRYWDIFSKESPWGKGRAWKRYYCQYYRLPDSIRELLRAVYEIVKFSKLQKLIPIQFFLTYGSLVGFPAKSIPFNENFICYGGYQWHTLSKRCVAYLKGFIEARPDLVRYYKKTVVSDESFVQTILVNSQKFKLCNDPKRYFDTHEQPGGHARILTLKDYSILTNEDFHFARKFESEVDSQILDAIDAKILGTTQ
ncbi:N-acetylglucosaminyltransferase [Candidatus Gracilibacteria bacterium]|nr:N-acetylglucosaminyltransferase [Candidatus Gracilibacteria bacterium]NJM86953.1 N-acetylglucosaminyltransferase [Hydrococcus sp. RU_2_2]